MPETVLVPIAGTTIPDIRLTASDGARSRLRDDIDGLPAVVFFMRAADCPVCVGHARTLARMSEAGQLGEARVLVVAPGEAGEARTAEHRIGSPSVTVRASGAHHADLGLGRFLMLQHSGTFVVDGRGRVLSAVTSPLPTASFSRAKVIAALGETTLS